MDTGGLAQMTYNNHNGLGGGISFPGSGFGTRGKGDNIKKLNVTGPTPDNQNAPRTSRSHLLAGLRTAPKSPAFPTSAPPTQLEQPQLPHGSHYPAMPKHFQHAAPKTSIGMSFPNNAQNQFRQTYMPEQILAPPAIQFGEGDESQMDPRLYDELVRTNQYLAQQQMRLQQQLINVTAAAQQFQNMNISQNQQEAYMNSPMSIYQQQLQQGVQPVINIVPGSPGLYTVYNPMTGQTTLAYDQQAQQQQPQPQQQQQYQQQPQQQQQVFDNAQGQTPTANNFRTRVSPPPQSPSPVNRNNWRSTSPAKTSTSPARDEATPLPPPSANAFRPGAHRKNNLSLANGSIPVPDGIKTAGIKSAGFPRTPMTGTFGPGQAQEGEHPVRQPRGPPSMEDLLAKPTTKHEGSKNFASRQRRGAVKNLVRAGIERRGVRAGSSQSSENGSPTSEAPLSVVSSVAADDDALSVRSGSASLEGHRDYFNAKPRSPNPGVIGSERKEFKERSRERTPVTEYTAASVSSDDDMVEVKPQSGHRSQLY